MPAHFDTVKTEALHKRLKELPDEDRLFLAINWRMAGTVMNAVFATFPTEHAEMQGINWYDIWSSRDLGRWAHGGKVICQG